MSHLFSTDRSLLYPQFETYRLRSLDPDSDLSSYHLPGAGATQSRVGFHQHHLSFNEVRARIAWDHLAVGDGGRGVYIDAEWNVVGFQLDVRLVCRASPIRLVTRNRKISSRASPLSSPSLCP